MIKSTIKRVPATTIKRLYNIIDEYWDEHGEGEYFRNLIKTFTKGYVPGDYSKAHEIERICTNFLNYINEHEKSYKFEYLLDIPSQYNKVDTSNWLYNLLITMTGYNPRLVCRINNIVNRYHAMGTAIIGAWINKDGKFTAIQPNKIASQLVECTCGHHNNGDQRKMYINLYDNGSIYGYCCKTNKSYNKSVLLTMGYDLDELFKDVSLPKPTVCYEAEHNDTITSEFNHKVDNEYLKSRVIDADRLNLAMRNIKLDNDKVTFTCINTGFKLSRFINNDSKGKYCNESGVKVPIYNNIINETRHIVVEGVFDHLGCECSTFTHGRLDKIKSEDVKCHMIYCPDNDDGYQSTVDKLIDVGVTKIIDWGKFTNKIGVTGKDFGEISVKLGRVITVEDITDCLLDIKSKENTNER